MSQKVEIACKNFNTLRSEYLLKKEETNQYAGFCNLKKIWNTNTRWIFGYSDGCISNKRHRLIIKDYILMDTRSEKR